MVNVFAVPGKQSCTTLILYEISIDVTVLVPVFFICFRESLETGIIVSVLLAFLKQMLGPDRDPTVYKKLVRQVSQQSIFIVARTSTERCNI